MAGGAGRPYRRAASRQSKPVRLVRAAPPIPLAGDPRAALHPIVDALTGPGGRGCDHPARRRPAHGGGGASAAAGSTATTPRTSRSSWPRRPAPTRGPSPTWSPTGCAAADGRRRRGRSPAPASSTSPSTPAPRAVLAAEIVAAGRGVRRTTTCSPASGSTSSSSPPTPPARSTWGTPGGPSWATPLGRVLEAAGAEVTREFYFNDHGNQIEPVRRLARWRGALGEPVPEDGYGGDVHRRARRTVVAADPDILDLPDGEAQEVPSARSGVRPAARRDQAASSHDFGVALRRVVPEDALHESGDWSPGLEQLPELRNTYRRRRRAVAADHRLRRRQGPGAHPVQRRADLLRQRHRLLRRQARARLRPLHLSARRRPPRVRRPAEGDVAACRRRPGAQPRGPDRPAGQDPAQDGEQLRLSKRAGTIVTLDELVDAIGVDALRYALARYTSRLPARPRRRP